MEDIYSVLLLTNWLKSNLEMDQECLVENVKYLTEWWGKASENTPFNSGPLCNISSTIVTQQREYGFGPRNAIWQERVIYIDSLWYKILVQKWSQNLSSSWLAEYSCTWSHGSQGHYYYLHLFFVFSPRPWRFVPTTWKLWKLYFFLRLLLDLYWLFLSR